MGASLAEMGLKRATPLGTATLVLAANLPDVDGVTMALGRDASLYWRRGWTHGLLAMVVLPVLLAGAMLLWDRAVRRRRRPDAPPARFGPLLALSCVGVLSHPALDWLNTYGVRLLMPFDARWFYGDTLFIIDPWLWLLAAAPVVLARSRGRPSAAAWIVLGSATSALVLGTGLVPLPLKAMWLVGVAAILAVRLRRGTDAGWERWARWLGAAAVAYVAAMYAGSRWAERQVTEWLRGQGITPDRVMAGPLPANPFIRDVIVLEPGRYRFVEVDWLSADRYRFSHPSATREAPGPVVEAALQAPQVRGFAAWTRFPTWDVEEREGGFHVVFRDLRYSRMREGGIGHAAVELDRDLRPRPAR